MSREVDAVLPLIGRDLDRARTVLWPSLERHAGYLGTCHVVVPRSDLVEVKRAAPAWAEVHVEDDIVPEIELLDTRRARLEIEVLGRMLSRGLRPDFAYNGWYRQQIVKLLACRIVTTSHYLTLDADVVAVPRASGRSLVVDGRSLRMEAASRFSVRRQDWYDDAADRLGVSRVDAKTADFGITPALLAVDGVEDLLRRLAARELPLLARHLVRKLGSSDASRLVAILPWTEYCLYFLNLLEHELLDRYHFTDPGLSIYGPSLWHQGVVSEWARALGSCETAFFFVVVQSNRGETPEQVVDLLRQHALV